jgi:branched-chain amino acid transport system substrate-binding protein
MNDLSCKSGFTRRRGLAGLGALALISLYRPAIAASKPPVKIGELASYARLPNFTKPYRQGWMLAVEQINGKGGVLNGHKIEIISRDDQGTPADSQIVADQLVSEEKTVMLMGSSFFNIADAIADYANQRPVPFLAIQPLTDQLASEQVGRKKSDNPDPGKSFLLRPSLMTMTAIMVEQAAALPANRWAIVAPNDEFGRVVAAAFQADLTALRPDVEFVGVEMIPLNNIDAPETVSNLIAPSPDAIFNACFGRDLLALLQEGMKRGLFLRRPLLSLLTGEPEFMVDLHKILVGDFEQFGPSTFIVTGYPPTLVKTPEHVLFRNAYLARYAEEPQMASVLGYSAIQAIAAALNKAGKIDTDSLVGALAGLEFNTPFGPVTLRTRDHQSTMGVFVGRIGVVDNQIAMIDGVYKDGRKYLPTDQQSIGR